jgi:hypothetical protein
MQIGREQRHGTESKRTGVLERAEIDGVFPMARLYRASVTGSFGGIPPGYGSAERLGHGLFANNHGEDNHYRQA